MKNKLTHRFLSTPITLRILAIWNIITFPFFTLFRRLRSKLRPPTTKTDDLPKCPVTHEYVGDLFTGLQCNTIACPAQVTYTNPESELPANFKKAVVEAHEKEVQEQKNRLIGPPLSQMRSALVIDPTFSGKNDAIKMDIVDRRFVRFPLEFPFPFFDTAPKPVDLHNGRDLWALQAGLTQKLMDEASKLPESSFDVTPEVYITGKNVNIRSDDEGTKAEYMYKQSRIDNIPNQLPTYEEIKVIEKSHPIYLPDNLKGHPLLPALVTFLDGPPTEAKARIEHICKIIYLYDHGVTQFNEEYVKGINFMLSGLQSDRIPPRMPLDKALPDNASDEFIAGAKWAQSMQFGMGPFKAKTYHLYIQRDIPGYINYYWNPENRLTRSPKDISKFTTSILNTFVRSSTYSAAFEKGLLNILDVVLFHGGTFNQARAYAEKICIAQVAIREKEVFNKGVDFAFLALLAFAPSLEDHTNLADDYHTIFPDDIEDKPVAYSEGIEHVCRLTLGFSKTLKEVQSTLFKESGRRYPKNVDVSDPERSRDRASFLSGAIYAMNELRKQNFPEV